jgi:hypothetical protein
MHDLTKIEVLRPDQPSQGVQSFAARGGPAIFDPRLVRRVTMKRATIHAPTPRRPVRAGLAGFGRGWGRPDDRIQIGARRGPVLSL